jgi:hypothetical protein
MSLRSIRKKLNTVNLRMIVTMVNLTRVLREKNKGWY